MSRKRKIVIGVTGASGTIYAIDLMKKLKSIENIETHVVFSAWAKKNLQLETEISLTEIKALADYFYSDIVAAFLVYFFGIRKDVRRNQSDWFHFN